jgi:hypothetical protein
MLRCLGRAPSPYATTRVTLDIVPVATTVGSAVGFPTALERDPISKHHKLVKLFAGSPVPFPSNARKGYKVCRPSEGLHFMTQLLNSQNPSL